jgi:hypothetical protein
MNADSASYATTQVVEEHGLWVVYLTVTFWEYDDEPTLFSVRHRIAAYATRRQADIAAEWIARNANRDLPSPPTGL